MIEQKIVEGHKAAQKLMDEGWRLEKVWTESRLALGMNPVVGAGLTQKVIGVQDVSLFLMERVKIEEVVQ